MNSIFIINKNRLFTSDWHIFHKNIWKYEDRFSFIGKSEENLTYNDKMSVLSQDLRDKEVLKNDFVFFSKVFENLKEVLKNNNKITEFYCLGDFIFELNNTRIERIKSSNFEVYTLILDIFSFLKKNNIKTYLILGNHDSIKEDAMKFYKRLFDIVVPYLYLGKESILISHVPVNRFNVPLRDSCINYNLGLILEQLKKEKELVNYHGHTHSHIPKELIEKDKGVRYINTCLDFLINK